MSSINQASSAIPNLPQKPNSSNINSNPDAAVQGAASEVVESVQVKRETITENYRQADQEAILIQLKQNNTGLNRSLLQGFMDHGLPLTSENFKTAHSLISHSFHDPSKVDSQTLQAILVTMRKGLSEDKVAFKILQQFYQQGSQLNQQTLSLLQTIHHANQVLGKATEPLIIAFSGLLGAYDKEYNQITKESFLKKDHNFIKKLMGDSLAIFTFLKNLPDEKMTGQKELFKSLKNQFEDFLKSMSQQFIFSKSDKGLSASNLSKFDVFEIPNILGAKASSIEIVVRYKNQKSTQENTDIESFIISFETDELGKIALSVKVLNQQDLSFLFFTEKESSVKEIYSFQQKIDDSMKKFNYNLKTFEVKRKVIDINTEKFDFFTNYQKIRVDV